jgi:hypothetical protein
MERRPEPVGPERGITRTDLEVVIRRAAELYMGEAEASERLTETEVLRVADELGLPRRYVRQALYELPANPAEPTWLDRWYGLPTVQGTRVVPLSPDAALRRLEEYLVTRELLQLLRRQGGRAIFAPADDTISNVARAVRRPGRHWQIARSQRVHVEVRPMPEDQSHVRIDLDLDRQRGRALKAGVLAGGLIGLPLAAAVGAPVGLALFDLAGATAALPAAFAAGAGTLAATLGGAVAVGRKRFRARADQARLELAGLLDRLEQGDRLDPPAAPWLRGLRSRIASSLPPGPTR